jgi:uncharacterized delta-60 repeat protein
MATHSERNAFRPRLEALEERCLLSSTYPSAGALDITFNGTGNVALAGYGTSEVVVQPDGKILAGGVSFVTNHNQTTYIFALVRFLPDGRLDSSSNDPMSPFGTNGTGIVTTVPPNGTNSGIQSLALQSDGMIVAVGAANGASSIAVARYTKAGALDTNFGSGGIVETSAVAPTGSNPMFVHALAVAIDGSGTSETIYVGGDDKFNTRTGHTTTVSSDFVLFRYNATGSLDTSFGGRGFAITPNFGNTEDHGEALALQSDGNILLAGIAGTGSGGDTMALARYLGTSANGLPAGTLDPSFGKNGIVYGLLPSGSTQADAYPVLVQNDGAIVLGGQSYFGTSYFQSLARLDSRGALDTSFGNTGQNSTTDGSKGFAVNKNTTIARAIAQGADGDLLAAGTAGNVTAFLPDGAQDSTFGVGGTTIGGVGDGKSMALQADGKIVVGGTSYDATTNSYTLALARFLPPNTKIGTLAVAAASYNPDGTIASLSLSASNILNSYPANSIKVNLFLENSNNSLTLLGSALMGTDGKWTLPPFANTYNLTSGTYYTFVAQTVQTVDGNSVLGDPLAQNILL